MQYRNYKRQKHNNDSQCGCGTDGTSKASVVMLSVNTVRCAVVRVAGILRVVEADSLFVMVVPLVAVALALLLRSE